VKREVRRAGAAVNESRVKTPTAGHCALQCISVLEGKGAGYLWLKQKYHEDKRLIIIIIIVLIIIIASVV
jgi:hypothetical protein